MRPEVLARQIEAMAADPSHSTMPRPARSVERPHAARDLADLVERSVTGSPRSCRLRSDTARPHRLRRRRSGVMKARLCPGPLQR